MQSTYEEKPSHCPRRPWASIICVVLEGTSCLRFQARGFVSKSKNKQKGQEELRTDNNPIATLGFILVLPET